MLHRSEILRDKTGDIQQVAAVDDNRQIKAAAHQIQTLYLRIGADADCKLVKADAGLRAAADLNQRSDAVALGLAPVDNGFISENDVIIFIFLNSIANLRFR